MSQGESAARGGRSAEGRAGARSGLLRRGTCQTPQTLRASRRAPRKGEGERRGGAPTGHVEVLQLALVARRGHEDRLHDVLVPRRGGLYGLKSIPPTGGRRLERLVLDVRGVLVPPTGAVSCSCTTFLCPDGAWGAPLSRSCAPTGRWGSRSRPPCSRCAPVQGRGDAGAPVREGEAPATHPPPSQISLSL